MEISIQRSRSEAEGILFYETEEIGGLGGI
jgi:hypothetical protein